MSDNQNKAPEQLQDTRTHFEGLGDQWATILENPAALMPQVVGTVLSAGGTRECWRKVWKNEEYVLMAWPETSAARAAVIMRGPVEGELKPASVMPLLEGLPNNFQVEDVHVWTTGVEANVAVNLAENSKPMWFYDPLYFRDREDLTPGVTHTFLLSALAYGLRKALLDEMTISSGPQFDIYAKEWLAQNPDKSSIDVPPVKVPLTGTRIIMPGKSFGEYQMRVPIKSVETTMLEKQTFYMLHIQFGIGTEQPLDIMLYVPERICKDYVPKEGDDMDTIVWLQGRIIDI